MGNDKDDKWQMPKPVFRSSPGALPKSLQKTISGYNMPTVEMPHDDEDDGDILSVMDTPADGQTSGPTTDDAAADAAPLEIADGEPANSVETETDAQVPAEAGSGPVSSEPVQQVRAAEPAAAAARKGGAGSFFLIFLLITAAAVGLIYGIYYYLSTKAAQ